MKITLKQVVLFSIMTSISVGDDISSNSGFYIGPMIGVSSIRNKSEIISGTDGSKLARNEVRDNTFLYGGIIGWGLRSGCLYGALEFDGYHSDISKAVIKNEEFSDEKIRIKNRSQFGGGIRFGFIHSFDPTTYILPFVRVGFQIGEYQRKYTVMDMDLPGGQYVKKASTKVFSVVPVIGAELVIKKKYGIRLEGRYAPRFTHKLMTGTVPDIVAKFSESRLYTSTSQGALIFSAIYYI